LSSGQAISTAKHSPLKFKRILKVRKNIHAKAESVEVEGAQCKTGIVQVVAEQK